MLAGCFICCTNCRSTTTPCRAITDNSPFAQRHLLAAGTLVLPTSGKQPPCNHAHCEDFWHSFQSDALVSLMTSTDDERTIRSLSFLVQHEFVSVTVQQASTRDTVFLRVYLVPWDLSNVQGRLLRRNEGPVLSLARKLLRSLLPSISQNPAHWQGVASDASSNTLLLISNDDRTMAEIYGDLPSPKVDLLTAKNHQDSEIASGILEGLSVPGLRSEPYNYQRTTVATLLDREINPGNAPDPHYVPLKGVDGKVLYLQPAKMEILRERARIAQVRGGVLCEELGTGKTVMILALILATLNQLPEPEESIVDVRPVLSPLSFRHFPSETFADSRKRAGFKAPRRTATDPIVPSLVETLLHFIRTSPEQRLIQDQSRRLRLSLEDTHPHLHTQLTHNTPFYYEYNRDDVQAEIVAGRKRRRTPNINPRTMCLSPATLVVVPPNLLGQWTSEIHKHCEGGALRTLTVRQDTQLPSARELAFNYDVILMTHSRFSNEGAKLNDINLFRLSTQCACPPLEFSRVPNCTCSHTPPGVSSLHQVRWKRLVLDEGHIAANIQSNLVTFARRLSIERRWIVTGTPTTNLLGLSFGKNGEVISDSTSPQPDGGQNASVDSETIRLDASDSQSDSDVSDDTDARRLRIWGHMDGEDLRKLGGMMIHFLGMPQYAGDIRNFLALVKAPLLEPSGPAPGAIQALEQIMAGCMFRHRIEDVEKEVMLPPLAQSAVYLDLEPASMRSYNVMQAMLALNAVDSERADADYMFHPSNNISVLRVMEIISQILFWSADDQLYQLDEIKGGTYEEFVGRALERNVSPEDLALLNEAWAEINDARTDEIWKVSQSTVDVPFRVSSLHAGIFSSFSRFPFGLQPGDTPAASAGDDDTLGYMHADRLVRLRALVSVRPRAPPERVLAWGTAVAEEEAHREALGRLEAAERKPTRGAARGEDSEMWRLITRGEKRSARATREEKTEQIEALRAKLREVQATLRDEDVQMPDVPGASAPGRSIAVQRVGPPAAASANMLRTSVLAGLRIGRSTSSKINFIVDEVLRYSTEEKFLIFSKSPLSLAFVRESLELAGVECLEFAGKMESRVREQLVTTFETSDKYRVFLMELKHGARGLNLTSASRVIFCEPVWKADEESQAIKRVHRIGQVRPITVKTLAIRNTAEELMVARREALKNQTGTPANWTEENEMRQFIANPRFLKPTVTTQPLDFPLLPGVTGGSGNAGSELSPQPVMAGTGAELVSVATNGEDLPSRKKRAVKFAV